jgi:hypothetical protein
MKIVGGVLFALAASVPFTAGIGAEPVDIAQAIALAD